MTPVRARGATLAVVSVCAAAILPYLSTFDNYFVRDDFGVVQLLAQKPAWYFPRWFYTSWMDYIWGFTPDEVRPFPAVSYQLTALGGAASPVLHHVLNILIHAANGLLVLAIARTAAGLPLGAAALAGVVFVLLPVHAESVAWITGRVDSMPALFYLASFLAYARWREARSRSGALYLWSVLLFFIALFSKQNTITMVATLAAYDLVCLRRPWRPMLSFVRPYLPFFILTVGYLWLRYLLFGEVAREGTLNARGLMNFAVLFHGHLTHVVTGSTDGPPVVLGIVLAGVALLWFGSSGRARWNAIYFGPIWWVIGVAPVAVAGYSSPRHVYLAAVGYAVVAAMGYEAVWTLRPTLAWHKGVVICTVVAVGLYLVPLATAVGEWNTMAAVSQKVVRDLRSAALASAPGSLVIVGAPVRSWEWALPFAVRPPFVRGDLTERVRIVSPRALSCCSSQWFGETQDTLKRWASDARPESVLVLRWDEDSGALFRATSADNPQLPVLVRALPAVTRPEELDSNLRRMIAELTVAVE